MDLSALDPHGSSRPTGVHGTRHATQHAAHASRANDTGAAAAEHSVINEPAGSDKTVSPSPGRYNKIDGNAYNLGGWSGPEYVMFPGRN